MNFREHLQGIQDPNRREHFVYWAYDAQGVLLYIGCTMKPRRRWNEHRAWGGWSRHVVRFRAQGPYNFDTARHIEQAAILEHQPPFNGDTPAFITARQEERLLFEQLFSQYQAEGMTLNDAGARAIAEVDEALPRDRLYERLRSA